MASQLILTLVILTIVNQSPANLVNNNVDDDADASPLADAAAAILKEQTGENIGSMVNNLVQGGGLKHLGEMLLNNDQSGPLLQGLNSLLDGNQGGGNGFDPSLLSAAMNMLQPSKEGGLDSASLMSMLGAFMGDRSGKEGPASLMDLLPMLVQTIGAFTGPEAERRAAGHAGHAWILPPMLEKAHLAIDHFMHSEMGRNFINNLGAEKFMRIFEDETGKYNYNKFVEMMENHSFRRHWIRMVTDRIADTISHFTDPKEQKRYLTTVQQFLNGVLRSQGFPKNTLFDYNKPVETLTNLINYAAKTFFQIQFSSKQYVKPAVGYIQELFKLAKEKGIVNNGVNSRQLSEKLADTINMEVIEPLARVNRAYRFAKKVPECDKYVMCVVNEKSDEQKMSLPGLKTALSRVLSLAMSWPLSSVTKTSFWTLYGLITDNNNCQIYFTDKCNDFHVEETKTTTEYVHNEL